MYTTNGLPATENKGLVALPLPGSSDTLDRRINNGARDGGPKPPDFDHFRDLTAGMREYIGTILSHDIQGVKALQSMMHVSRDTFRAFAPSAAAGTARLIKTLPEPMRPARFKQLLDFFLHDTPTYTGPARTISNHLHCGQRAAGLAALAEQLPSLQAFPQPTQRFDDLLDACGDLPEDHRNEVIVALAGSVGAVAQGERTARFVVMSALVDELPDAPRAAGLAGLARQLEAIEDHSDRSAAFDTILEACDTLPHRLKSQVQVALAGRIAVVAQHRQSDQFQTMLDLVQPLPDAQRAEGLAALAGQLFDLRGLPDPAGRFNALVAACSTLPPEVKAPVLVALAENVRTLAIGDHASGFDTMFECVMSLPEPGRAQGLAALGRSLAQLWPHPVEGERFDRIFKTCERLAPQHQGVALAGLAAGISSFQYGRRDGPFRNVFNAVLKVSDPAGRADGLVGLAQQLTQFSIADPGQIDRFRDILGASVSLAGVHRARVLESLAKALSALPWHDGSDQAPQEEAFVALVGAAKELAPDCRFDALLALIPGLRSMRTPERQSIRFADILDACKDLCDREKSFALAALADEIRTLRLIDWHSAFDSVLAYSPGLATYRGAVVAALARQPSITPTQVTDVLEASRDLPSLCERATVVVELGKKQLRLFISGKAAEQLLQQLIQESKQLECLRQQSNEPLPVELQLEVVEALAGQAERFGHQAFARLLESIDSFDDNRKSLMLPMLAGSICRFRDKTEALAAFDGLMARGKSLPQSLGGAAAKSLAAALRFLPQEKILGRFRDLLHANLELVQQDSGLQATFRFAIGDMDRRSQADAEEIFGFAMQAQ